MGGSSLHSSKEPLFLDDMVSLAHGFVSAHSYKDAGRSGVAISGRKALKKLLTGVAAHRPAPFKAVLVYNVSRWGRFQDSDEAAHYEFLCKQCGVSVHYSEEPLVNDGTGLSSICHGAEADHGWRIQPRTWREGLRRQETRRFAGPPAWWSH